MRGCKHPTSNIQHPETLEERVARVCPLGELVERVVDYCLMAGPPWCYQKWPRGLLHGYLSFHALNNTLAWTAELDAERLQVTGCGVAWQTSEKRIEESRGLGEHVFNWSKTDPEGDSLFLADFIVSRPGMVEMMLKDFEGRFPGWKGLKWWTYRKGELVRLNGTKYARRFEPKGSQE